MVYTLHNGSGTAQSYIGLCKPSEWKILMNCHMNMLKNALLTVPNANLVDSHIGLFIYMPSDSI